MVANRHEAVALKGGWVRIIDRAEPALLVSARSRLKRGDGNQLRSTGGTTRC